MKRWHKKIAWVLILTMMISLAGCGGKQSTESSLTEPSQSSAASTESSQEEVKEDGLAGYAFDPDKTYEIEWCVNETNAPTDEDTFLKLYIEEKYNVRFNIWHVDRSNREELLNIRFTSGEFPDILSTKTPTPVANYEEQGLIMELPMEVIKEYAPTIYKATLEVEEETGQNPFIVSNIKGKNYGIPSFNTNGRYHYTSLWRGDWLEAVGVETIPETLEEFESAFYKIVENKQALIEAGLTEQRPENIYALSSGRIQEPFASVYGAFGYLPYYWEVKDDQLVYGGVQPEMKEALTYLSKWYQDGILNPEFITGENRGDHWAISHDFIEGRIAYTNNAPFY